MHLIDAVEKSLARLRTSYIDVYQIHAWDAQTPPESWLLTMRELVQAGKIRSVGVSNVTGWQLQKILMLAKDFGVPIASLQTQSVLCHTSLSGSSSLNVSVRCVRYNLLCREVEYELINCSIEEDLGVLCWSPLKGGWLTGKFKKDEAPAADSRVGLVEAGKVRVKLESRVSCESDRKMPLNRWRSSKATRPTRSLRQTRRSGHSWIRSRRLLRMESAQFRRQVFRADQ